MSQPLISVVTPFFDTAPYLADCIESVLAQTHSHFEYILMDNCSTDGSSEIAAAYARRDRRIRLISCSVFLPQLPNYNRALAEISADSKYCKMVQADDWIFPQCLELMVAAFEQSERIGLVGSYWMSERMVAGSGLPAGTSMASGKACARWVLRTGATVFGTPTQVMYRASLVRSAPAFFNASFAFADLQKHIEILADWDFGFVHQVLSFWRKDNESILRAVERFDPTDLLWYVMVRRYGGVFLEADETRGVIAERRKRYYRGLASAALRWQKRPFWEFHKAQIGALDGGEGIDRLALARNIVLQLLWFTLNPAMTATKAGRKLARFCKKNHRLTETNPPEIAPSLHEIAPSTAGPRCGRPDIGVGTIPKPRALDRNRHVAGRSFR